MRLIIYKYIEIERNKYKVKVYINGVYKESECIKIINKAKKDLCKIYAGSIINRKV